MNAPWARRTVRALLLGLLATSSAFVTADAFADEGTRASAQVLFDDAMKLIEQKDFDHACPKLAEVVRLQPGKVGAMLELSRCYVGAGKVASAWARYRAAADAARTANDERAAEADAKAAELAPRVPRIAIVVYGPTKHLPGLVIKLDGVEIGAAELDAPMPIDAGKHKLTASAPDKRPWMTTIDVAEGTPTTVKVPALEDASSSSSGSHVLPFIPLGLGVIGLGVGAVTGAITLSKASDIKSACRNNVCPANQSAAWDSAQTLATVSDVAFVVGGVSAAVGLTWLLWPSGNGAPAATATVGPGSVSVKGSF